MATKKLDDAEHAAFMAGFHLAHPPGPEEADALERAEDVLEACPGSYRVAIPTELAREFLIFHDTLPANSAAMAWAGFLRGMIAQSGAWPGHFHESGRAFQ